MPPERIGGYEVLREPGSGRQAAVYLCRDPSSDREAAVKVLRLGRARLPAHPATLHTISAPSNTDAIRNIVERAEAPETRGSSSRISPT